MILPLVRPRAVQGCSASGGRLREDARQVRQRENRNFYFSLILSLLSQSTLVDVCSLLQSFALSRSAKNPCSIFASCLGGERSLKCCTMLTMDNGGWWQWGGCWPKGVRLFGVGGA